MAERSESLRRLGGGRWETRDGRFAIEPQSGTWVIVDTSQTNELGLPLVRGPYPSLTAAKEAIEDAREAGPSESPLAGRLERAKASPAAADDETATARRGSPKSKATEPARPPAPKEPAWLSGLSTADRRRAKAVIETLESISVDDPEEIVRHDLVDDDPALARLAIGRRLARLSQEFDLQPAAVKRLAALFGGGRDDDLAVRWRLVDGDGREIGKVEPIRGD